MTHLFIGLIGFVAGAVTAGFVILNNKNKALALLQEAKEAIEAELAAIKAKNTDVVAKAPKKA